MPYLLHHYLTENARRQPEAIAVRLLQESMTYAELEALSNRLAHALIAQGVRPRDRVGIYLHKSPQAIAAIFAVLKTGACYVPVDANAPGSRLADIALQSGFRSLVTSQALAKKAADHFVADCPMQSVFFVDGTPGDVLPWPAKGFPLPADGPDEGPPQTDTIDHDLAYILFTSGSTGKPKGVMLSHLNALTFVCWACDAFQITPEDRLSNHAPFNFDLSVFDIFAAIKAGACICLVPEGLASFPIRMAGFIEEQKITIWYSVPMILTLLLSRGKLRERNLGSLRWILFAGEVFPTKHLRELMNLLPQIQYANLYGPTETNVCAYYVVKPIPEDQTAAIPIGKACANTQLIALDEHGRPVTQPGKEGLLYARGSTVMQGYHGRPLETEACFIRDHLSEGREEKLYCTGDWVTLDEEGNYLFLGRKDHMIKTRGYRVELGEIETAIYNHPAIREAAVVALPDELIGNRLKAFLVLNEGPAVTDMEIKQHCAKILPSYMVPDEIAFRTVLPRTGTDKIDRRTLVMESASPLQQPQNGTSDVNPEPARMGG